jgi:cytolysin (calcineurin-like family phosphatase)
MKTSSTWNFRSIVGKIIMGLVLVSMIGIIDVVPAHSKNNKQDNRRYEQQRGRSHYHGRPVYRPYGYYGHRERVYYPPPPVVWAPPPPPGITIFAPPIFIHP